MRGYRSRLLACERLEYLERRASPAADAVGGPENQARMRMTRNGLEDLTRLLRGKRSIPLQQSGGMPQRNIQCSNGLRNAVQLKNIQWIPVDCYQLIRISGGRFVKSATRVLARPFDKDQCGRSARLHRPYRVWLSVTG